MDVCSSRDSLLSKDLKSLQDFTGLVQCSKLSVELESTHKVTEDCSLNDLGSYLSEILIIHDGEKKKSRFIEPPTDESIYGIGQDDVFGGSTPNELSRIGSDKCLTKCATFPSSASILYSTALVNEHEDRKDDLTAEVAKQSNIAKSANQPCEFSVSVSTPLKLVSAMKGGREKEGTPTRKLNVTWAPDVFDPPPSSLCPVSAGKVQRRKSYGKKGLKNKDKASSKSSRSSSKGKEKKHARKYAGSSKGYSRVMDGRVIYSDELHESLFEFNVSRQDPFCGSSFLG